MLYDPIPGWQVLTQAAEIKWHKSATLAHALLAFQSEAPALQRDKINPAFRSSYLSLQALMEEVLPVLNRHGLAVVQLVGYVETETGLEPTLTTRLVQAESGEQIEETMLLRAVKSDPQAQGSAITYARRYQLMAMLALVADEDDDASTKPASARRSAPGKITRKQRDEIFAAIRARSMPTDKALAIVRDVAGVEQSEDIPAGKFRDVLKAIKEAK